MAKGWLVPGKTLVGVHMGPSGHYGTGQPSTPGNNGGIQALNNYEQWWGRTADFVAYNPGYSLGGSLGFVTSQYQGLRATKNIGMCLFMVPFPQGGNWTTLVNTTTYDASIKAQGAAIVASGNADAAIRVGHEADGNYFYWGVQFPGTDATPALYKAGMAKVFTLLRAVPGNNFALEWNFGALDGDANIWNPGSQFYDVHGHDVYAEANSAGGAGDPVANWKNVLLPKLEKTRAIADAGGVPMALSEFGVCYRTNGLGTGDDPYYLTQLAAYCNSHNVAYIAYFNDYDSSSTGTLAQKQLARSQNNDLCEPVPNTSFIGPYVTGTGAQPGSNSFVNAAAVWQGPLYAKGALGVGVITPPPPPSAATTTITARHDRNQTLLFG